MKGSAKKNHIREYRVLAIAIVFFATGLFFFLSDRRALPTSSAPAKSPVNAGNPSGLSVQPAQPLDPDFASFPPPAQFRTFTNGATGINGRSSFTVSSTCSAAYVAILIFPSRLDYRSNIQQAVYNRAFACDATGTVSVSIMPADLGAATSGTYYYFTADEGTSGLWYNPK